MKKKISRLWSIVLVLMLCMAFATPALADAPEPSQPINKTGKVQFDKDLITEQYAVLPTDLTFTFKLTAANAEDVGAWDARTTTASSLDGISVSNASGTTASDVVGSNLSAITVTYHTNDNAHTAASNTYTKGFVVDFSTCLTNGTFSAPGVYRYKVEEIANSTSDGITYATNAYYIDVFVQNATNGSGFEIANIVVMSTEDTTYTPDATTEQGKTYYDNGDKVDGTAHEITSGSVGADRTSRANFENPMASPDLTVTKSVTGNQGDKNKYFTFTVTFTNLPAGTYTVDLNDATATENNGFTSNAGTGTYTFEVTESETTSKVLTLKLKDGQSIKFLDLPYGAKYTVAETSYTSDGYTTSYSGTEKGTGDQGADTTITKTSGNTYNNSVGIKGDTTVTFENNKEGTIPTGILMTIAPFVALMLIGIVGATVILRKKRYS